MERGRLEAFSDGVMAVAITLLALDLAVRGPGYGPLGHQLAQRWPSFAAYVISFFTIGVIWVNHHALVREIVVVDRLLLFLNLLLLLFVVAIPFATATMAEYLRSGGADAELSAAIYAGVLLCMGVSFYGIFEWSLLPGKCRFLVPPEARRGARLRFGIGNVAYVGALGAAFLSPDAALAVTAAVAVYYMAQRSPRRDEAPA